MRFASVENVSANSQQFLWIGNDPSLDFVNTDIVTDGQPVDLLETPEDYLAWLKAAGIEIRTSPSGRRSAKSGLQLAKNLRSKLRQALQGLSQGQSVPQSVIADLNGNMNRCARGGKLKRRESKFDLLPYWNASKASDYAAPLAWAFANLLSNADLVRIRKCKNPECVLFFYDTSKSGTRTWCSLDLCGNRMRMAALRERHRNL